MAIVITLIFAAAFAIGMAAMNIGRRPEQRRLARLASGTPQAEFDPAATVLTRQDLSWFDRLMRPFAGDLAKVRAATLEPIRRRLIYAGFRRDSAVMTFMGSRVAFAMGLPLIVLATPASWSLENVQLIAALLVAAGIGLTAPSFWLDNEVRTRQKALRQALPDALDLMVVCVEAGLGINASLRRVSDDFRSTHPVLADEFELANAETRAGKSTTESLRALAERTGVAEIGSLSAMLIQTERFGTGLADALRIHADGMRVRRLQSAEEQANKAPLKMLLPTTFIFIAMIIIVVGPGLMQMSQYFSRAGR